MNIPLPKDTAPAWAISEQPKNERESANSKVKTYHWTPEEIQAYLHEKYPHLQKPKGKKPSTAGAWQTKSKPKE